MAQYWVDHRHAFAAAAWVSVKECRRDLQRLAEHICEQLSATGEAGRHDTPPTPLRERPRSLHELADWLRDTKDLPGSKVLICFDDLEFDPHSIDQIEDFMLAASAEVEFIAATSADTGFARMKARQAIQELRGDALAFTFDEAKAVACGGERPVVSEAEIHSLWKRTKGWPEIFCLLMQAASESRSSPDRLVADRVTGRDIDLDKYFRRTILNSLADDVLEFCVCASILGSVSADYFNHVFRRNDGAYYIDKLSAEQMVLRPLDRSQTAYEFHPLLREFLEHRFSVEHRGSKPNLLARAAQWQRQNSNSRESISLSLRAGENESAAEVASENMMDIALRQGEIDQIQSWQGSFSAAVVSGAPTIALGLAWAQIFSHDHQRAAGLLADLRAVDLGAFDQQTRRQMECWCDLIAAIGEATGDNLTESRRLCEAWIKLYGDANLVCKGAILTCLCFIAASEHRFDDQRKVWLEASSVNNIADHRYALGWLHSTTIFAELSRGDMHAGAELLRKARNDDNAQINTTPFSVNLLNTLELELQYEANQLDGIETRVEEILDFARQHGIVDFIFSAYRTAAAIDRHNGDLKGAVERLQEMRVIAGEFDFLRLDVLARLTLADLFVVESAEQATAILPNRSDPIFLTSHGPYLKARQSLTEARIAARQGKFHLANRLANVALDHARRFELGRLEISALLCAALAYAGTERSTMAEQHAADAVDIASRSGCYRTLLDERAYLEAFGSISTPLLNLIPSEAELGRREPRPGDRHVRSPSGETSVVLTRKELAMLQRVKEGCSNREIAITHRISEDTVKWHIRNIFSKLQVKNRVQALLKAERIGILH
ncbi:LuxR C-terminal-related transcriptional regulator [Brevundimonas mediterranea]|uniref:LuxR family maltose regulon positive regulatory protein n=1 Tax=Brevundimonas mediterranea TaxID=74329 RepID=A0A7W6A234_9CAUL|nr:LuxR C-terminal-related transcriptional regulator [Brevundimonas mediterranea]MBB3871249.1 LuxR family maltose regulon positive regulatory protein [Brevundimonas mediterranea]